MKLHLFSMWFFFPKRNFSTFKRVSLFSALKNSFTLFFKASESDIRSNLKGMQQRNVGRRVGGVEQHPSVIAYIRALHTGRQVEGGLEKKSQILMTWESK